MASSTPPVKEHTSPASSSKTDTSAPASKERRKKKTPPSAVVLARIQKNHRQESSAITKLPVAAQLTTERPTIQALINNVEEVRRFVAKHLNVELAKFMAKAKPTDEKALEKWERKRQDLEIDWGTIPGVGKPFLKQPGAEKFFLWLQLRPKYINREVDLGNGHLEIISKVIVYSKKTQEEVFEGPDCSCSTMESNYRYRMAQSAEKPDKAKADHLKSMGLGRWKKVAEWKAGKKVGEPWVWFERVENPNIYDERNKVRQIGEKRALVKCARGVGAMSEIFTSDPNEWDDVRSDDDVDGDPYTDMDYTAGGRRIVEEDGHSPSGKPVTHEAKKAEGRAAAQAVAEEKKAAASPSTSNEGEKQEDRDPFNGVVEIDQTNEADPIVRGDIAAILPVMQRNFRMTWKDEDKAWHIDGRDVDNLFEMCRQLSYHYWHFIRDENKNIIEFADGKRVKKSTDPPAATEAPKTKDPSQAPAPQPTTTPLKPGESLVTGKVKDYYDKMTTPTADTKDGHGKVIKRGRQSVPYLNILFTDSKNKAIFINTFDHDVFPWIGKARSTQAECVFVVKTSGNHTNITGMVRIGTQEFVDGKVPVVPLDREPGTLPFGQ